MPLQRGQVAPQGGGSLEQNLYRTGFDSSWEIDVFGGTRRRVEAAQATVDAAVEDRRGVLVTLLGDVAKNYIDVRALQRRLTIARDNLKAQQDLLDLTKIRFDAGLASDWTSLKRKGKRRLPRRKSPRWKALSQQRSIASTYSWVLSRDCYGVNWQRRR